ncbi:uncharacterized protein SCDLUD_003512 [Saccharomycodes ludwigii]|uniref:uncharacterized protein n=1 Tax=Saccharomycodes ludwigii TaxID=36035 RepID=UPI001E87CFA4|nr:hypothetical protein SCDLUD_003512 [Saccharomycodes ludwigii]KAH3900525.1 hypothetical protein SCDLUD_003512 [Saccharomycodes ludwigii]
MNLITNDKDNVKDNTKSDTVAQDALKSQFINTTNYRSSTALIDFYYFNDIPNRRSFIHIVNKDILSIYNRNTNDVSNVEMNIFKGFIVTRGNNSTTSGGSCNKDQGIVEKLIAKNLLHLLENVLKLNNTSNTKENKKTREEQIELDITELFVLISNTMNFIITAIRDNMIIINQDVDGILIIDDQILLLECIFKFNQFLSSEHHYLSRRLYLIFAKFIDEECIQFKDIFIKLNSVLDEDKKQQFITSLMKFLLLPSPFSSTFDITDDERLTLFKRVWIGVISSYSDENFGCNLIQGDKNLATMKRNGFIFVDYCALTITKLLTGYFVNITANVDKNTCFNGTNYNTSCNIIEIMLGDVHSDNFFVFNLEIYHKIIQLCSWAITMTKANNTSANTINVLAKSFHILSVCLHCYYLLKKESSDTNEDNTLIFKCLEQFIKTICELRTVSCENNNNNLNSEQYEEKKSTEAFTRDAKIERDQSIDSTDDYISQLNELSDNINMLYSEEYDDDDDDDDDDCDSYINANMTVNNYKEQEEKKRFLDQLLNELLYFMINVSMIKENTDNFSSRNPLAEQLFNHEIFLSFISSLAKDKHLDNTFDYITRWKLVLLTKDIGIINTFFETQMKLLESSSLLLFFTPSLIEEIVLFNQTYGTQWNNTVYKTLLYLCQKNVDNVQELLQLYCFKIIPSDNIAPFELDANVNNNSSEEKEKACIKFPLYFLEVEMDQQGCIFDDFEEIEEMFNVYLDKRSGYNDEKNSTMLQLDLHGNNKLVIPNVLIAKIIERYCGSKSELNFKLLCFSNTTVNSDRNGADRVDKFKTLLKYSCLLKLNSFWREMIPLKFNFLSCRSIEHILKFFQLEILDSESPILFYEMMLTIIRNIISKLVRLYRWPNLIGKNVSYKDSSNKMLSTNDVWKLINFLMIKFIKQTPKHFLDYLKMGSFKKKVEHYGNIRIIGLQIILMFIKEVNREHSHCDSNSIFTSRYSFPHMFNYEMFSILYQYCEFKLARTNDRNSKINVVIKTLRKELLNNKTFQSIYFLNELR